jgi:hypothetical protein
LSRFESVDAAIAEAQKLIIALTSLAQGAVSEENPAGGYDLVHAFLLSGVARARGLADAIVREIAKDNQHAVFALLRPLLEVGGLLACVREHPEYATILAAAQNTAEGGRRVSWQKIWNVAARRYSGIKKVYEEVCDVNHFGSSAFWMSWRITNAENHAAEYFVGPGWREDRYRILAATQLVEFLELVNDAAIGSWMTCSSR